MRHDPIEVALREHAEMQAIRALYEHAWTQVTDYVFPRSRKPSETPQIAPQRLMQPRVSDTTAGAAAMRAAAFFEAALVPRGQRWHELRLEGTAPGSLGETWLESVTDTLFRRREEPGSRFSIETGETLLSLVCFGTGCLEVVESSAGAMRYRAVPLSEIWIAEDLHGAVDKVHREYEITARQAKVAFGDRLTPRLASTCERAPETKVRILHRVVPRQDYDPGRGDRLNMPWASLHISLEDRAVLREAGYLSCPYKVSRLWCAPGEVYGRGMAMAAMPSIRALNVQKTSIVTATQRAAEPPLLTFDDDLPPLLLTPNAVNAGWLDRDGRPLAVPLQSGVRPDIGFDLLQSERESVREHFLGVLFDLMVERPQMTATEVLERAAERGILLGPIIGQQQDERLGPLVAREIDLGFAGKRFPPVPPELEGQSYKVTYETAVTRRLGAQTGAGLLQVIQALAPLVQVMPGVLDPFEPVTVAREVATSLGVPLKLLRDDGAIAQLRADQAAAQAQQMAAAAAVEMAKAGGAV